MTSTLPIEHNNRAIIVDVIRGFALVGVLIANFTGFVVQQTPESILNSMSSSLDVFLMSFNSIFIEWKFVTLFSILFGYGFGLILESLERKNIHPNSFFIRRMFWLFILGCMHSLFWWGDVLHLYAMSGMMLLLFRKKTNQTILLYAVLLALMVPVLISFAFRNHPETFTDADIQSLYDQYKQGNILDVFKFNVNFYYRMFILSGGDLHDLIETLGRFLFGYFLLRIKLFHSVEEKKAMFRKIALSTAPFMGTYFIINWLVINKTIHVNQFILDPLLSLGILSTTIFYVSVLVIAYISLGMNIFFTALQSLGRMTLTNYLMVSMFLILLLYGVGLNKLGELSIHIIWLFAFLWLLVEILISIYWLKIFRYGPTEWIWRQLTYWKRLPLRK
ncbi:MAG: DUF418 domain-containing protein [Cyclobacteriaceae bacterium]|nr:DUF418 domain-containing protein [Cyclobacteriaceae bacterium]